MKGNNFFYVVKNLEVQQLVVRQSTIVRGKEPGSDRKDASESTSIVTTNLLYLHRFAKNLDWNSQKRIEISRPDKPASDGDAHGCSLRHDGALEDDVSIRDFLPAMKAICDKLETASGKVNFSIRYVY